MPKIFYVAILFCVSMITASGQDQKNTQPQDTTLNRMRYIDSEFLFDKPNVLFHTSLRTGPEYYPSLLQPSFTLNMQPFSWRSPEKIDLTSSWRSVLTKQEELKTLRTILGTVQFGGVAYLAYRHLKKYGLK
jgi:hypothetical protein